MKNNLYYSIVDNENLNILNCSDSGEFHTFVECTFNGSDVMKKIETDNFIFVSCSFNSCVNIPPASKNINPKINS